MAMDCTVTITSRSIAQLSVQKSFSSPYSSPFRNRFSSGRLLIQYKPQRFCRTWRFTLKCTVTDTDVQFNHAPTAEEIPEGCSTIQSDCSATVVHLDSDLCESDFLALESKPLNLLTKETYVDSLLTTLPVLSEDEQNAIAATPAHPEGLYALYASCIAGNMVEQLWNFAWPSAIALLHPSLLPVAVMGFFTKLTMIVGGPLLGKFMDTFPRVPVYTSLNIIQAAAQLVSASMVIYAHTFRHSSASSILLQPWFIVLVLVGAVERLCGVALGVAVERDWVVLLAGINRPIALAEANAVLSRIDLLCEIAGASLFGFLLSKYEPVTCLKFAASLMFWSLPSMVFLTWLTNKLSSGVLDRAKCSQSFSKTISKGTFPNSHNIIDVSVEAVKNGWKEYMDQPVLPASLAYVFLYFNVVLTPGSLMTAFLTQRGLNPSLIGGFTGLCGFMGVAATFISAYLIRKFGLLKAGAVGLIFQASVLTMAVAVYWSGSLSRQTPLLFFLSMIVISRLGNMSYVVVGQQILQIGIPSSKANLIGATEMAVASLAESVMLGMAIIANDVSHYGYLAFLSLLSGVGAALLFCRWLVNPTEDQRSLFSFEFR